MSSETTWHLETGVNGEEFYFHHEWWAIETEQHELIACGPGSVDDGRRWLADHARARQVDAAVEALTAARVQFDNIRGDWSEPRDYIREGWRVIDEALRELRPAAGDDAR